MALILYCFYFVFFCCGWDVSIVNCLLTSLTILNAALPTAAIVIAENQYGNIAPTNNPQNGNACKISTCLNPKFDSFCNIVINPLNNANDTNAALPIAKPLPIAAVVFPAASNASVRSRVVSPIKLILINIIYYILYIIY